MSDPTASLGQFLLLFGNNAAGIGVGGTSISSSPYGLIMWTVFGFVALRAEFYKKARSSDLHSEHFYCQIHALFKQPHDPIDLRQKIGRRTARRSLSYFRAVEACRRTCQRFEFTYTSDARDNGCCPIGFTGCAGDDGEQGAGKVTIDIAAKRTDGTSLSANDLTYPHGYPGGFQNTDLKCDQSGRLCCLCVHLDGDYNCADYAVEVTGANNCDTNYVTFGLIWE
ncbi:hypothetical protein C8R43DRAFT_959067 [Mycena crocata]|nr:hypothetical protein C8R43DRAFT_959067 [Mycena crocata]